MMHRCRAEYVVASALRRHVPAPRMSISLRATHHDVNPSRRFRRVARALRHHDD